MLSRNVGPQSRSDPRPHPIRKESQGTSAVFFCSALSLYIHGVCPLSRFLSSVISCHACMYHLPLVRARIWETRRVEAVYRSQPETPPTINEVLLLSRSRNAKHLAGGDTNGFNKTMQRDLVVLSNFLLS
jgi:hypothetical protein